MMTEGTGKTIDEALQNALETSGLELDQVDVEVLEEGARGFLGLGAKPARVRITPKDTPALRAETFLRQVTALMGVPTDVEVTENEEQLSIELVGEDNGVLIGYRGETLDALQYLTSLYVNKNGDHYLRVSLDTENYRAKREETLSKLANRLANKARRSGRRVVLEPMNPYERRILHATLQGNPYVTTYSEGEDPNRRVVIAPKQGTDRRPERKGSGRSDHRQNRHEDDAFASEE